MKKLKKLFGKFIEKCKAEKNFRYAVIIVSLIVIAFAVNEWREWEDSKELPPTAITEEQTEDISFMKKFRNDSKMHFFLFG